MEQVVVRRGQFRRIGWVIKTLEAQVGQFPSLTLLFLMIPTTNNTVPATVFIGRSQERGSSLYCGVVHVGLVLGPFALTTLANQYHFLIYTLSFSVSRLVAFYYALPLFMMKIFFIYILFVHVRFFRNKIRA